MHTGQQGGDGSGQARPFRRPPHPVRQSCQRRRRQQVCAFNPLSLSLYVLFKFGPPFVFNFNYLLKELERLGIRSVLVGGCFSTVVYCWNFVVFCLGFSFQGYE
jgi:hypothetical protein